MKVCISYILCSIILLSSVCTAHPQNVKDPRTSAPKLLTVEETIDLVDKLKTSGPLSENLVKKLYLAHPDARQHLYVLLNDETMHAKWPMAIGMFAYIGDDDDVMKLEDFVKSRRGVLGAMERIAVQKVFDALGEMSRRGSGKASRAITRMAKPSYWNEVKFSLYDTPPQSALPFEERMALDAMRGVVYSMDEALDDRIAALMDESSVDKERLTQYVDRLLAFRDAWAEQVEQGTFGGVAVTNRHEHIEKNVKAFDPKRSTTKEEALRAKEHVESALNAFLDMKEAVLESKLFEGNVNVLDDGRPVSNMKLNKSKKLRTDLLKHHDVLRRITTDMITFVEYENVKKSEIEMKNGRVMLGELVVQQTLTVHFEVIGTKGLVKKVFGDNIDDENTRSKQGNVIIVMIKISGEWHWNPFAW